MGVRIAPWEEAIFRGEGAAYCKVYGHSVVSCAKTAKMIKLPFWLWSRVDQRNHILDGDPDHPMQSRNYYGKGHAWVCPTTLVSCAKMAELIKMSFGLWTLVDPRSHVLDVGPDCPKRRGNFGGEPVHARRQSAVSCAKMAEPTEMPFGLCGLWAQGSMCYMVCTRDVVSVSTSQPRDGLET